MSDAFEAAKTVNTDTPDPVDDTATYVDQLVGEGKKFKDVEALARGKAESDAFINSLQEEMAQLRNDVNARKTSEDVLAEIKADLKANQVPVTTPEVTPEPVVDTPDIAALVKQALAEQTTVNTAETNISTALSKLTESHGDASVAIALRAKELGVSPDFLKSTAAQSPDAFMAMFPVKAAVPKSNPTTGTVNTEAMRTAAGDTSSVAAKAKAELRAIPKNKRGPDWYKQMQAATVQELGL